MVYLFYFHTHMVLYNMPSKSYIFVDSLPIACDNNYMQNTVRILFATKLKNVKFIFNLMFLVLFSPKYFVMFSVFLWKFLWLYCYEIQKILLKNRIYEIFKSCFATTLSCKCYPFWTKKFKKIKYKSSPNCKN